VLSPAATTASAPFERALEHGSDLWAADAGGRRWPVPVARWRGDADAGDLVALDRIQGPVLDVGCGPGRALAALAARGVAATGIDISPAAVALARARGTTALRRSVWEDVPWPRRWRTALLLDGNVGIGGDPVALLDRVASVVRPGGSIVAELATHTAVLRLRLECPLGAGEWFDWALLDAEGIACAGTDAGLEVVDRWSAGAREFAELAVP